MEKFFEIPIDQYAYAVSKERRPKYSGAFLTYEAFYYETTAYLKAIVKEEYYDLLIKKSDVTILSKEKYNEVLKSLKGKVI